MRFPEILAEEKHGCQVPGPKQAAAQSVIPKVQLPNWRYSASFPQWEKSVGRARDHPPEEGLVRRIEQAGLGIDRRADGRCGLKRKLRDSTQLQLAREAKPAITLLSPGDFWKEGDRLRAGKPTKKFLGPVRRCPWDHHHEIASRGEAETILKNPRLGITGVDSQPRFGCCTTADHTSIWLGISQTVLP